jgi:C4-dicarboxylate-specific signal transduction histidine kinase
LSVSPPPEPVYTIIVTSRTEKRDIAYALENGADDYITKPFDIAELRARINVGIRLLTFKRQSIDSNARLLEYTKQMEKLAEDRAEQLVRADRLSTIGRLSAGIAHEINNPCSFIAVNIQTIEEHWELIVDAFAGVLSDEKKAEAGRFASMMPDIIDEMKSGVTRIKRIVNGLKTYAHPLSGKSSPFRLDACIESALQLCANKLKYHVRVKTELTATPKIFGDLYQIEQVFVNLFTNAADAIEESGKDGTLTVTTKEEGGFVIAAVRDSGPGFPKTVLENLFVPFKTTKPVGNGTGLGLSISRNIVKDHKGDLIIENHPDGGAYCKVMLPGMGREVQ